jgi:hypothetical protein
MAHIRKFKAFHEYNSYYPYYLPSHYSNVQAPSQFDNNTEGGQYNRYYEPTTTKEGFVDLTNVNHQLITFLVLLLAVLFFYKFKILF